MAELVDAHDSKSCWGDLVRVRFPLAAQQKTDHKFGLFFICCIFYFAFLNLTVNTGSYSTLFSSIILTGSPLVN